MATKHWISTSSTTFATNTNWSDSASPANGDTLIFNHYGTANVAGANTTLTGVTVIIEKGYTGQIGSITSAGVATYLQFDGGTFFIGRKSPQGSGTGSTLILIKNNGSNPMTVNVLDTASSSGATYYPPVLIAGDSSLSAGADDITINQSGGNVGVCMFAGEAAGVYHRIALSDDADITPKVTFGIGAIIRELTANGGEIVSYSSSAAPGVYLSGNTTYTYHGTGGHTTLDIAAGSVARINGTGTTTTCNLRGGSLDFSRDSRAKTVTTLNTYRGYSLNVNNGEAGSITFANPINHYDGLSSGTITDLPGMKGTLTNI